MPGTGQIARLWQAIQGVGQAGRCGDKSPELGAADYIKTKQNHVLFFFPEHICGFKIMLLLDLFLENVSSLDTKQAYGLNHKPGP